MKIMIEDSEGKTTVYQYVTDYYLCVRQTEHWADEGHRKVLVPATRSFSWGSNVRELVKEVAQSLVELQDFLRSKRNGDSG